MSLWWICPNCKNKIDYTEEMSYVFDEEGEADFNPALGLWFHTIMCKCGANWTTSISKMEIIDTEQINKLIKLSEE